MPKCSLQLSLYQCLHGTLATSAQVVLFLQMQILFFTKKKFVKENEDSFGVPWEYSISEMGIFKIN